MGSNTRRDDPLQRQAFDLVAQLTQAAVIVTDASGLIRWVNASLERLTGYAAVELTGRNPGALLQGEGTDASTIATLRDHIRRGEPVYVEILNYHKSGHEYWQSLDIVPIRNSAGELVGFVGVQNDVTYRRRMEGRILDALAAEQRRIAATLHDGLGQQLTGVSLFATALSNKVRNTNPDLLPLIGQMTDATRAAIEQCRAIAIQTSGFAALVQNSRAAVENIIRHAASFNPIPVSLEWSPKISGALSDREFYDVYRIVQEAVTNAARHARATGITVIGEVTSAEVKIVISDDGKGISPGAGGGTGRQLLLYRAQRLGATVRIDTRPAFQGTRVSLICSRQT